MKAAFLALSLLGHPLAPVSDRLPSYDVEALCGDGSADDKASGLADDASKCVSDETAAKQQPASIRLTVPAGPRESCEILAMSGGGQSYVDLLTCLQMAGWIDPPSLAAVPLKGASKNRNAAK
jgi:hypothetical protein